MALATCWALSLIYFEVSDPPLRGQWRLTYMVVISTFRPIAWLNLANHWGERPIRWLGWASMLLYAVCVAVFLTILWLGLQQGLDTVYLYVSCLTALLSVATTIVLLRKIPGLTPDRRWEFAIYVLVCTLLQAQLIQRTAELEAAHGREKELVRAQAHQSERQRIMRDMHDGLGSQLMSMLLAARRGVAKPAAVAEGLQSVIDEMRLLIDSMDSVGESLGSAFAMFRERVKGRVEEAGLTFGWRDASHGKLPELGPREVLQVFRVMQEAVTNALKHSNGTAISVSVKPSPDTGYSVRIAVADNGRGMCKSNPRGKGMDSMAARAAGIGGRLDVQSGSHGMTVLLDLPQR